jgi:heme oxygenase
MGTVPSLPLLDQLRSITWHRHEAFERLPFVSSLVAGTLPLESYIGQLRGFAVIFSALEQALAHTGTAVSIRGAALLAARFDLLCTDLAFFAPRLVPDILPAVRHALATARTVREVAATSPDTLLGYLYVLEGTTKGNQVHLQDIVRCFHLQGDEGVSFYRGYGIATPRHWEEFRAIMNAAGEMVAPAAIHGAIEMYDHLEQFHASLSPLVESERGYTATALNPEAGDHPVPQNPLILQAALRAGRRCRDEFSYYERRYGERGRRFTESDAAWLAALADQPASVVTAQVQWLGRVLSARGMPFLLMERQLELLVEELEGVGSRVPTEALRLVVAELRVQSKNGLSGCSLDETCGMVSRCLSDSLTSTFSDLPLLLVAAQCDLRAGMPECMASLTTWLKSVSLVTDVELAAVRNILASNQTGAADPPGSGSHL